MNPETGMRHFENWMSFGEYKEYRSSYIKTALPILYPDYREKSLFRKLSEREKQVAAACMVLFTFGANMAHGRMGRKYEPCERIFAKHTKPNEVVFYWVSKDKIVFSLRWFLNAVKKASQNLMIPGRYAGVERFKSLFDLFELAGVEETAHYMYVKEKGKRMIKTKIIPTGDPGLDPFTSEPERRALIWKKAYARHYMPQYYESLDETQRRVDEAIKNSPFL